MLIEKISQLELDMIDTYRKCYAYSGGGDYGHGEFCDVKYLLRNWEVQKANLCHLLGDQLMITKSITYEKSWEELQDEVYDLMNRRWGRVGRTGAEFANAYMNYIWHDYDTRDKFTHDQKNGLDKLVSDKSLIDNRYDGPDFELDLPDGKKYKIVHGCKVGKALGKIAQILKLPGYEDFRICHSQILNQKVLTGDLTISIHPLDYMTMSDNASGWDSCMNWQGEGGYRRGTVEMMNSTSVVVAYLSAAEPMKMPCDNHAEKDEYVWSNKKWRQLFFVNEDAILAIKDYPYHNNDLSRMVMDILLGLAKQNMGWTYEDMIKYGGSGAVQSHCLPEDNNEVRIALDCGAMYNDLGALDYHWLCLSDHLTADRFSGWSGKNTLYLPYSGPSQCMVCGAIEPDFDDESCLACYNCQTREHCDWCEETVGETYEIDGVHICEYCWDNHVRVCEACNREHLDENMMPLIIIPRLTDEEKWKARDQYESRSFIYKTYTDNFHEFNYIPDNSDWWLCNDIVCRTDWAQKYLIDGANVHQRDYRGDYYWCVYFDELNEKGLDRYAWGYKNNDEYKRMFKLSRPYPAQIIED